MGTDRPKKKKRPWSPWHHIIYFCFFASLFTGCDCIHPIKFSRLFFWFLIIWIPEGFVVTWDQNSGSVFTIAEDQSIRYRKPYIAVYRSQFMGTFSDLGDTAAQQLRSCNRSEKTATWLFFGLFRVLGYFDFLTISV